MKNIFFSKSSSSYSKDTIDILRLIRSENVGPKTFVELVKLFGSASIALDNISEFAIKGGRSKPIKIYSQKEAEDEISKLNDYGGCFLTYKDSRYPELLRQMHDFPPIISYKGNIELMSADTNTKSHK